MCASVTKQYNLVLVKGQWCSSAGKVTAGLAGSDGSLPPGLWLSHLWVDCQKIRISSKPKAFSSSMGLLLNNKQLDLFQCSCVLLITMQVTAKTTWHIVEMTTSTKLEDFQYSTYIYQGLKSVNFYEVKRLVCTRYICKDHIWFRNPKWLQVGHIEEDQPPKLKGIFPQR